MTRFALAAELHTQARQPSTRVRQFLQLLDTTRVRVILVVMIVLFGLLYLWLVNSTTTRGFYLSDLESQVATLEDEYKKLEIEQAAAQSLNHLQEQAAAQSLVAAGRAEYAHPDAPVALGSTE